MPSLMDALGRKKETNQIRIESQVFAIYDSKINAYGLPQFAENKEDIIRELLNVFREPDQQRKNKLFLNAEDFSLFKIGVYDKRSGEIQGQNVQHIVNFHDLRTQIMMEPKQAIGLDMNQGIVPT